MKSESPRLPCLWGDSLLLSIFWHPSSVIFFFCFLLSLQWWCHQLNLPRVEQNLCKSTNCIPPAVGTFISDFPVSLQVVPTNTTTSVPCFLKTDPSALCLSKKAQIPPKCFTVAAGNLPSHPAITLHDTMIFWRLCPIPPASQKFSGEVYERVEGHRLWHQTEGHILVLPLLL